MKQASNFHQDINYCQDIFMHLGMTAMHWFHRGDQAEGQSLRFYTQRTHLTLQIL